MAYNKLIFSLLLLLIAVGCHNNTPENSSNASNVTGLQLTDAAIYLISKQKAKDVPCCFYQKETNILQNSNAWGVDLRIFGESNQALRLSQLKTPVKSIEIFLENKDQSFLLNDYLYNPEQCINFKHFKGRVDDTYECMTYDSELDEYTQYKKSIDGKIKAQSTYNHIAIDSVSNQVTETERSIIEQYNRIPPIMNDVNALLKQVNDVYQAHKVIGQHLIWWVKSDAKAHPKDYKTLKVLIKLQDGSTIEGKSAIKN